MVHRVSVIEPRTALEWIEGLGYEIAVINKESHEPVAITADELINNWGSSTRIEDLLLTPL